jgi:hypothetical protein
MSLADKFEWVERSVDEVLLHTDKPVWIVYYDHDNLWKVYFVTAPLPKGRKPWTVDNRSLNKDGYRTLEEASKAAHELAVAV